MSLSQLAIYSIGYVAENKLLSSTKILVTPIESLPLLDGEIKSNVVDLEASGTDASGQSYMVKVSTDNAVEAEWLSLSGNRVTPPDVRRGERVLVWRYGELDKYRWSELGSDLHLRKLETVIWTFSGTTDEEKAGNDPKNSYYVEISTHNKTITLHTSSENGEPFEYTFQFNTGEGVVTLSDDVGNYVEFDSAETRIRMENAAGTWFELNKRNIGAYAPDSIMAKAINDIILNAGKDFNVTAGGSIAQKAGATATVEGGAGAFLVSGGVKLGVTPGGIDMEG